MHVILTNLLKGTPYPSERNNEILKRRSIIIESKYSYGRHIQKKKKINSTEYTVLVHEAETTKDLYINLIATLGSQTNDNKTLIPKGTKIKFVREVSDRAEIGQKRLYSFYFEYQPISNKKMPIKKFCFPLYREEFEWIGTTEMNLCVDLDD